MSRLHNAITGPRAKGEYLGGSRVRYTWPCGHSRSETLMVGPKGRGSRGLRKPMSPAMAAKLASYWGGVSGVQAGRCPTCRRKSRVSSANPEGAPK